jgi:uncharacterized protein (TIGR02246 family)
MKMPRHFPSVTESDLCYSTAEFDLIDGREMLRGNQLVWTSMRVTIGLLILVFSPLVFFQAQTQANGSDTDKELIKQVISNWSEAFNNRNAHAVAVLFSKGADLIAAQGVAHHGHQEIEKAYAVVLAGDDKNALRTDSVKSIRFLTPTIASVDVNWEMAGLKGADRKGLLDWVLMKRNDCWFITVFRESDFISRAVK